MTEPATQSQSFSTTAPATTLRRATDSDLGAICELLRQSTLPTEGVAECLDEFFVAESDGSIRGAVGMERHGAYALLRSAVVAPEARGRGVGHRLVERLLTEAELLGLRSVYLLTTTAENYFPEFGFSRITREAVPAPLMASPEFQGACPASAIVMRKELPGFETVD